MGSLTVGKTLRHLLDNVQVSVQRRLEHDLDLNVVAAYQAALS